MNLLLKKSARTSLLRFGIGLLTAAFLSACGGGGGSAGTSGSVLASGSTTTTTLAASSLSLILSATELPSSGASGTEVTITALVKNANNNVMEKVPVTFSASSGAIAVTNNLSDASGQVKATLSTGGDRNLRSITVTAVSGSQSASGTVNVTGTTVIGSGPTSIITGNSGDITVTVKDSGGTAIPLVPVTFSSKLGNALAVKSSGGGSATQPLTNTNGQVVLTMTGSASGTDIISFSSQNASSSISVSVSNASLTVSAVDASGNALTQANINNCTQVASRYTVNGAGQSGTVTISVSRGSMYSDAACTTALVSGLTYTNGNSAPAYVQSTSTGIATFTAAVTGGPSSQGTVNFVAPLTSSAIITLQADPGVIGVNTAGSTNQQTTIRATVRDGTSAANYVEGATVQFSIINDLSGGTLLSPFVTTTNSSGVASVVFVAGSAATPTNGVTIQGQIMGVQGAATTKSVDLTVAKQSLFITAGTGNTINAVSATTYSKDYVVVVTDSAGNAVSGVSVTASVVPTNYRKGYYVWNDTDKLWVFANTLTSYNNVNYECGNEDKNGNGILDTSNPTEDTNNNGRLDPLIPLSVTSSGVTDKTGTATVTLTYPKDRSGWTVVKLTIRGTVSGSEAVYITVPFALQGLAADFSNQQVSPPGQPSPYGTNPCTTAD
ncbi:MAG: Ig-like domain-containing protein [Burkholderiales bacterium]|nr:Ig-like domain-containing protein [Burkholderiales bacterium]